MPVMNTAVYRDRSSLLAGSMLRQLFSPEQFWRCLGDFEASVRPRHFSKSGSRLRECGRSTASTFMHLRLFVVAPCMIF